MKDKHLGAKPKLTKKKVIHSPCDSDNILSKGDTMLKAPSVKSVTLSTRVTRSKARANTSLKTPITPASTDISEPNTNNSLAIYSDVTHASIKQLMKDLSKVPLQYEKL